MVMRADKALALTKPRNLLEISKYDHSHFTDEEDIYELIYSKAHR